MVSGKPPGAPDEDTTRLRTRPHLRATSTICPGNGSSKIMRGKPATDRRSERVPSKMTNQSPPPPGPILLSPVRPWYGPHQVRCLGNVPLGALNLMSRDGALQSLQWSMSPSLFTDAPQRLQWAMAGSAPRPLASLMSSSCNVCQAPATPRGYDAEPAQRA
jgi:hypothetical protein